MLFLNQKLNVMKKLFTKKIVNRNLLLAFTMVIFFNTTFKAMSQSSSLMYGITLCGAEFGEKHLPGVLGVDSTYPNAKDISYFASKGVNLIQLPFKWERIQKVPGGLLDQTELGHINKFVDDCADNNIKVNLVLQNFGRYQLDGITYVVGSPVITAWDLADFWKRMARAMFDKQNIYGFSIMTEPHDMGSYSWANTVQQVINGIREVDRYTVILVDGDNYSNPVTWEAYNDGLKNLKDPANKLMFNANCYFDNDFSGTYANSYEAEGAYEWVGVERMRPFVEWLNKNNMKGYVGEFGIPKNDQKWVAVMHHFLEYLQMHNIGASYSAAGAWWKDYGLSIQPQNNVDQPQMVASLRLFNRSLVGNDK